MQVLGPLSWKNLDRLGQIDLVSIAVRKQESVHDGKAEGGEREVLRDWGRQKEAADPFGEVSNEGSLAVRVSNKDLLQISIELIKLPRAGEAFDHHASVVFERFDCLLWLLMVCAENRHRSGDLLLIEHHRMHDLVIGANEANIGPREDGSVLRPDFANMG